MFTVIAFDPENPKGRIVFGHDQEPYQTEYKEQACEFAIELYKMFSPTYLNVVYKAAEIVVLE